MSIGQAAVAAVQQLTSYPLLAIIISLLTICLYSVYRSFFNGPVGRNPLENDGRRCPEPFVHDTKKRDAILKNRFKPAKVPDNLDAIFIGSGVGSLSAAVLLAKAGKKVLVLEQHDQAGGCCHSFVEKGFEFDTGIHYIGNMDDDNSSRMLLDQLTGGQLRWRKLDDAFDTVALGKASDLKVYPMKAGQGEYFYENLIQLFPQEQNAILAYKKLVQEAAKSVQDLIVMKILPRRLVHFLSITGLYRLLFVIYRKKFAELTLQEVLDGLTDNKQLKMVLSYIVGDIGTLPEETPFWMYSTLIEHYKHGAYYPANGSSEIGFQLIKVIQQAGGRVLVQAPVTGIVCDPSGRAVGVRVSNSENDIRGRCIISDAGVVNTFKKLLPENVAVRSEIYPFVKQIGPSYSSLSFFYGLEGSNKELNLPTGNWWLYNTDDINKCLKKHFATKAENIELIDINYGFLSFPSAKDPEWDQKYPGRSTVFMLTAAKWEWFQEWKDEKVRHRGDRYEGIKDVLSRKVWEKIVELFPHLHGKKIYSEVGTPVSNSHYMAASNGEIYGLDHGLNRFTFDATTKLRQDTDIPGLYLTGQDTLCCGMMSAVYTGVLCASKVLNRNINADFENLRKKISVNHPGPSHVNGKVE